MNNTSGTGFFTDFRLSEGVNETCNLGIVREVGADRLSPVVLRFWCFESRATCALRTSEADAVAFGLACWLQCAITAETAKPSPPLAPAALAIYLCHTCSTQQIGIRHSLYQKQFIETVKAIWTAPVYRQQAKIAGPCGQSSCSISAFLAALRHASMGPDSSHSE